MEYIFADISLSPSCPWVKDPVATCNSMDGFENIMTTEANQTEKDSHVGYKSRSNK